MSFHCSECPVHGRCDRCRGKNRRERSQDRSAGRQHDIPKGMARVMAIEIIRLGTIGQDGDGDDVWLLPPDDINDGHAVLIAVYGERHVALTYRERVDAATEILRGRGTAKDVCVHLCLPHMVTEDECQASPVTIVRKWFGATG